MSALEHPTHAIAAETRAVHAVKRVVSGCASFVRAMLARREINRLNHLTDHELNDIGLTRTDLALARRTPLGTDPTQRLSSVVRERYLVEDGARRVC